jgi:putative transposase
MKYALVRDRQVAFPVVTMCKVLSISTSGFNDWLNAQRASLGAREVSVHVRAAHQKSRGAYGSPRVHAELRAAGMRVGLALSRRNPRPLLASSCRLGELDPIRRTV